MATKQEHLDQLLASAKWSERSKTLKELASTSRLPTFAKVCRGVYKDSNKQPSDHILLHSTLRTPYVIADGFRMNGKSAKEKFSIPFTYSGWLEVMSEDLKHTKPITSVGELIQLAPKSFLVRSELKVVYSEPGCDQVSLNKVKKVAVGEKLNYCEQFEVNVKTAKKVTVRKFIRCKDSGKNNIFIDVDAKVQFNSISESDKVGAVHQLKDLLCKFRLPVTVHVIDENIPAQFSRSFLPVFRLQGLYITETVYTSPVKVGATMVALPSITPLHLFEIINSKGVKDKDILKALIKHCGSQIAPPTDINITLLESAPDPAWVANGTAFLKGLQSKFKPNLETISDKSVVSTMSKNPEEEQLMLQEIEDIYRYVREGGVPPISRLPPPKTDKNSGIYHGVQSIKEKKAKDLKAAQESSAIDASQSEPANQSPPVLESVYSEIPAATSSNNLPDSFDWMKIFNMPQGDKVEATPVSQVDQLKKTTSEQPLAVEPTDPPSSIEPDLPPLRIEPSMAPVLPSVSIEPTIPPPTLEPLLYTLPIEPIIPPPSVDPIISNHPIEPTTPLPSMESDATIPPPFEKAEINPSSEISKDSVIEMIPPPPIPLPDPNQDINRSNMIRPSATNNTKDSFRVEKSGDAAQLKAKVAPPPPKKSSNLIAKKQEVKTEKESSFEKIKEEIANKQKALFGLNMMKGQALLKSKNIESPKLEPRSSNISNKESIKMEPKQIDDQNLDGPKMDHKPINIMNKGSPKVEPKQWNVMNKDSPKMETKPINKFIIEGTKVEQKPINLCKENLMTEPKPINNFNNENPKIDPKPIDNFNNENLCMQTNDGFIKDSPKMGPKLNNNLILENSRMEPKPIVNRISKEISNIEVKPSSNLNSESPKLEPKSITNLNKESPKVGQKLINSFQVENPKMEVKQITTLNNVESSTIEPKEIMTTLNESPITAPKENIFVVESPKMAAKAAPEVRSSAANPEKALPIKDESNVSSKFVYVTPVACDVTDRDDVPEAKKKVAGEFCAQIKVNGHVDPPPPAPIPPSPPAGRSSPVFNISQGSPVVEQPPPPVRPQFDNYHSNGYHPYPPPMAYPPYGYNTMPFYPPPSMMPPQNYAMMNPYPTGVAYPPIPPNFYNQFTAEDFARLLLMKQNDNASEVSSVKTESKAASGNSGAVSVIHVGKSAELPTAAENSQTKKIGNTQVYVKQQQASGGSTGVSQTMSRPNQQPIASNATNFSTKYNYISKQ